jgi:cytochrome c oxidase cbb3-type subunit 4
MEFFSHIQSFWTLIAFITFIGIVVWAWSSRRKKDFSDAANLIFDEQDSVNSAGKERESGEQKHV